MNTTSTPIVPIAAAIVVPMVLGWLLRSPDQAAKEKGGKLWLEYGKLMKGMALLFAGLVALLVGLWFTVAPDDKQPVAWMVALFGLLDLPLLIEFFGVRIGFDDEQIYCHSAWRKNRVIPWGEIKSCTYSKVNKWWVIETASQGRIRIHEFISGRESFFEAMKRKTGISA